MEKLKAEMATAISFMFSIAGELAIPALVLLGLNMFDFYTGIHAAPYRNLEEKRPIKSATMYRGIAKKVYMYILIIIGSLVDILLQTTLEGVLLISFPPIFAITITCWLIFNEIVSILENMEDAQMDIPPFLLPLMRRIKGKIEEKADIEE